MQELNGIDSCLKDNKLARVQIASKIVSLAERYTS